MFLVHFKCFLHFIKSVLFRIFFNTSLKYKRECQKLRDRWGADPIHLTPAGYSALAESLLDSYSIEKEEKKDSADPVKGTVNRRDGLSRSNWTANRWDSGTAHGSQSRYLGPWVSTFSRKNEITIPSLQYRKAKELTVRLNGSMKTVLT